MKNKNRTKSLLFLATILSLFVSCEYQEIADAEYPEQTIYMPSALSGIFDTSVNTNIFSVPTTGKPSRYSVDAGKDKFIIPLGVLREGVSYVGGFSVNIASKADTITSLIAKGTLTGTELLPSDKYTLPATIEILDGKNLTLFNLDVNLSFLKSNPNKKYAIGVQISCDQRAVNPKFKTTIVVINTSVLNP